MGILLVGAIALAISLLAPPVIGPNAVQIRTDERVVVLPGPDGRVGTVVVRGGGVQQTLNQAYAASVIRNSGAPRAERLSPPQVQEQFAVLLSALPERPTSYALYFVSGLDELTDESRTELEKLVVAVKRRPVPDVAVIGHTDTVGDPESNDALSLQRAQRVKALLVEAGIAEARIEAIGRGERELLIQTGDNADEPRNRRVEINVR
jgi:OmpA-OmpF porin, OOP family